MYMYSTCQNEPSVVQKVELRRCVVSLLASGSHVDRKAIAIVNEVKMV